MTLCETESKALSFDACQAQVRSAKMPENLRSGSDLVRALRIEPGATVKLSYIDPNFCGSHASHEMAMPEMLSQLQHMDRLQNLLHGEGKRSVLIVLQGLDACGKDGLVRHLVTGMNPVGCRVIAFKQPTAWELSHDFLWRVHQHVPGKGEVVIFNRSHYEDVLVVRVHQLVPARVWARRYQSINDLERLLVLENRTTILKFLLHISKDEQLARFKRRLDDPTRRWKISEADYQEREHWDDYVRAFEDMLEKTSTPLAPWFVIPANHKWFRDLIVSQIITRTLEELDMQLPDTAVDIASIRRRYHAAEVEAKAS
jgi:PPK2 family polyphosphate:nucleotide phosphotransferase